MNKFIDEYIRKITFEALIKCIIGALFLGIGIGIWEYVHIGIDALNVLFGAISNLTNLPLHTVNFISGIIIFILCLIIDYRQLGLGTIINVFVLAMGIALAFNVLHNFTLVDNIFIKLLIHFFGLLSLSFGAALIVVADIGKSQYDAFIFGIAYRLKTTYTPVRYFFDGLFLITGILLGGDFGIGTIIAWFGIAPIMTYFIKVMKK